MDPLTEREFNEKARQAYDQVFVREEPYGQPFQPAIQHRELLFTYMWDLSKPWLDPVINTIKLLGEVGFYVTALERPKAKDQVRPYHWYVPLSEVSSYGSAVFSQENAVYSISGKWGIICSDEDHALIGGPALLIEKIREAVPDMHERVLDFLDMWKQYNQRGTDIGWLPTMLAHIYGPEASKKLLQEAQLDWLLEDQE